MIIPPSWSLPEPIRLRLGQTTYGRQRAIAEEGHVLLVLHLPPSADDSRREGILFWRQPSGEWLVSRGGSGAGALKRHLQVYADLETSLARQFEEATGIGPLYDLMETLTPLARATRNLHLALQSAREAIKGDTFLIEARDLAYELERNYELLLEDVRLAAQYRSAREAEEQGRMAQEALRASHRLNVIAALFLPLTAVAGLFSMNFNHGLNQEAPAVFWLVTAASVAVGLAMRRWVLAKPRIHSTVGKNPVPNKKPARSADRQDSAS